MENNSGMNEELEYLSTSEEYGTYIMENCHGDRIICNGDTLISAMEDGYLWDDFLDSRYAKSKSFDVWMAEQMAKPEYQQEG